MACGIVEGLERVWPMLHRARVGRPQKGHTSLCSCRDFPVRPARLLQA